MPAASMPAVAHSVPPLRLRRTGGALDKGSGQAMSGAGDTWWALLSFQTISQDPMAAPTPKAVCSPGPGTPLHHWAAVLGTGDELAGDRLGVLRGRDRGETSSSLRYQLLCAALRQGCWTEKQVHAATLSHQRLSQTGSPQKQSGRQIRHRKLIWRHGPRSLSTALEEWSSTLPTPQA